MNGWGKNSSAVLLVVGSRCKWWALVVLITAFQLVSSTPPSIGICAAVRREGLLLVEWLEYHSLIGVNNFYIYLAPRKLMSNQEADVTDGLLAPYLHPRPGCTDCPSVQIFRQERPRIGFHPQAAAFDTCLQDFAKENDWMFFIDIDEFIAFPRGHSLAPVLAKMPELPSFCIGRATIVPSAPYLSPHVKRPDNSLLTQLLRRSIPEFDQGKLAIFTDRSLSRTNGCHFDRSINNRRKHQLRKSGDFLFPHNCYFDSSSSHSYNLDGSQNVEAHCSVAVSDSDPIVLYHFFTRTCYEWQHELVQKRRSWVEGRGLSQLKTSVAKVDPDGCGAYVSSRNSSQALFLDRFQTTLRKRVSMHPLWGSSIQFFDPKKTK